MTDSRLTPFSGRVALATLRGKVDATEFTDGQAAAVLVPLGTLLATPNGPRTRQLLCGDAVTVIDTQDGHAFVQAQKDGYCGWIVQTALGSPIAPTHWIAARSSQLYAGPKVRAADLADLPFGARVEVTAEEGSFAQTAAGFVPMAHLRRLGDPFEDPVAVAEGFLGSPYLWGGNSAAGMDCSGLVQLARHACGLPCPGDSDMQMATGTALSDDAPLQRGDLIFWKGHVAMVVDAARLIHANGYSMSVKYEGLSDCIARIAAQGGGPVTARRRT